MLKESLMNKGGSHQQLARPVVTVRLCVRYVGSVVYLMCLKALRSNYNCHHFLMRSSFGFVMYLRIVQSGGAGIITGWILQPTLRSF